MSFWWQVSRYFRQSETRPITIERSTLARLGWSTGLNLDVTQPVEPHVSCTRESSGRGEDIGYAGVVDAHDQ